MLDISHNEIGDIGGIALGAGLCANDGLGVFNAGWNQIRQKGMNALINGLRVRVNLRRKTRRLLILMHSVMGLQTLGSACWRVSQRIAIYAGWI